MLVASAYGPSRRDPHRLPDDMEVRTGMPEAGVERPELSTALSRMAGVVLSEETMEAVLSLVVSLAQSTLPHTDGASISLIRTGQFETANATSDEVRAVDKRQYRTGKGPCVEAMRHGVQVNANLSDERDRWPEFVAATLDAGFGSVLSTPLNSGERPFGALNLYSRREAAFDEAEVELADVFVRHAAVVVGNAIDRTISEKVKEQLQEALATREVIGKAQGMLMVRHGVGTEEAFDMLRRASQHSNRKLRDVASDIVEAQERQARQ
jgi:GAF domain-containing protein